MATPVSQYSEDKMLLPAMTQADYERLEREEREQGLPVTPRPPGWDKVATSSLQDRRVTTEDTSKSSCCPCPNWFFGRNTKEKTD
jgi:hypothetical protein